MHTTITYLQAALKDHIQILTQNDKDLIRDAVETIWGEPIFGELGSFGFLRGVEEKGRNNEAKVLQLVTNYIIWVHGTELKRVSKWGYLPSHPLQQFLKEQRALITMVPSVIKHYVTYQDWEIDPHGLKDIEDYLPKAVERVANIE